MGEQYPITEDTYIYNMIDDISIIVMNTSIFSGQPLLNDKENTRKTKRGMLLFVMRENYGLAIVLFQRWIQLYMTNQRLL